MWVVMVVGGLVWVWCDLRDGGCEVGDGMGWDVPVDGWGWGVGGVGAGGEVR